jgi:ATP synthase protein I
VVEEAEEGRRREPGIPDPERISADEERLLRNRRNPYRKAWTGFAYFGMIGWSVAIPMLIGTAFGAWLDRRGAGHGWTLSLLLAGAALGCWNAWRLVAREERRIREGRHGRA